MLGLLVSNFVEQKRLKKYFKLKASGPYTRNPDGTCPDCHQTQIHDDECPRLLQIAGFHSNFRVYPKLESVEASSAPTTEPTEPQSLLDPLLYFPPEISSLILRYSLDHPSTSLQRAALSHRSYFGPIELALVCRQWHELVFADPRFWATMAIVIDNTMPVDAIHVVEACLARSGAVPLSILFTVWDPTASPELTTLCARAIAGQRTRWRDVNLNIHRSLLPLFGSTATQGTVLRNLQVQTFSDTSASRESPGAASETALGPTRFVYTEWHQEYRDDITWLPIHWQDIRSLDLSGITAHDLLYVLQACPRIELIAVCMRDGAADTPPRLTPHAMTLDRLTVLTITISCTLQSLAKFFAHISAPRVTTLAVMNRNVMDRDLIPVEDIISFLRRSGNTNLTSLHMRGPCAGSELIQLLELTPKLASLNVTNSPLGQSAITDEFWARLVAVDTTNGLPQFLPHLSSFHYLGRATFKWSLVADACEARMARPWAQGPSSPQRTLTSLVIKNHEGFTRDSATFLDRESLQRFLELPKHCLDISSVCLAIDRVLLEYSIENHGVQVDHDVGLYYSLPETLGLYTQN